MATSSHQTRKTLEVRIMFEPGYLASTSLQEAYNRLVPTIRRPVQATPVLVTAVPEAPAEKRIQ